MNRKPQPADSWWKTHQATCNGTFIKVSEPEICNKEMKSEEKQAASVFKGNGRTWSESFESESTPSKITDFFKKPTNKKVEMICVNCSKYKTESLKELNEHLDDCLNRVIDLT